MSSYTLHRTKYYDKQAKEEEKKGLARILPEYCPNLPEFYPNIAQSLHELD